LKRKEVVSKVLFNRRASQSSRKVRKEKKMVIKLLRSLRKFFEPFAVKEPF
jgi:hypothetical protein